jgi:hypothetical protein
MESQKFPPGGYPVVKSLPGLRFVALGGLGRLFSHSNQPNQLIKGRSAFEQGSRAMEIEKRVYMRLGTHLNL